MADRVTQLFSDVDLERMIVTNSFIDERYAIEELLGRGATANVLLVEDRETNQTLAMKEYHDYVSPKEDGRILPSDFLTLREAYFVSLFEGNPRFMQHVRTHLVKRELKSGHTFQGTNLFEVIEGETIFDKIKRRERPTPEQLIEMNVQLAQAAIDMQEKDVVHYDIGPTNVYDVGDLWVVGDFHESRIRGETFAVDGHTITTARLKGLNWVPNEKYSGHSYNSTDLRNIALLTLAWSNLDVNQSPELTENDLVDMPSGFRDLIRKNLAGNHKDRSTDAREYVRDLEKSLDTSIVVPSEVVPSNTYSRKMEVENLFYPFIPMGYYEENNIDPREHPAALVLQGGVAAAVGVFATWLSAAFGLYGSEAVMAGSIATGAYITNALATSATFNKLLKEDKSPGIADLACKVLGIKFSPQLPAPKEDPQLPSKLTTEERLKRIDHIASLGTNSDIETEDTYFPTSSEKENKSSGYQLAGSISADGKVTATDGNHEELYNKLVEAVSKKKDANISDSLKNKPINLIPSAKLEEETKKKVFDDEEPSPEADYISTSLDNKVSETVSKEITKPVLRRPTIPEHLVYPYLSNSYFENRDISKSAGEGTAAVHALSSIVLGASTAIGIGFDSFSKIGAAALLAGAHYMVTQWTMTKGEERGKGIGDLVMWPIRFAKDFSWGRKLNRVNSVDLIDDSVIGRRSSRYEMNFHINSPDFLNVSRDDRVQKMGYLVESLSEQAVYSMDELHSIFHDVGLVPRVDKDYTRTKKVVERGVSMNVRQARESFWYSTGIRFLDDENYPGITPVIDEQASKIKRVRRDGE